MMAFIVFAELLPSAHKYDPKDEIATPFLAGGYDHNVIMTRASGHCVMGPPGGRRLSNVSHTHVCNAGLASVAPCVPG